LKITPQLSQITSRSLITPQLLEALRSALITAQLPTNVIEQSLRRAENLMSERLSQANVARGRELA
jgi:hypothetical protein